MDAEMAGSRAGGCGVGLNEATKDEGTNFFGAGRKRKNEILFVDW